MISPVNLKKKKKKAKANLIPISIKKQKQTRCSHSVALALNPHPLFPPLPPLCPTLALSPPFPLNLNFKARSNFTQVGNGSMRHSFVNRNEINFLSMDRRC